MVFQKIYVPDKEEGLLNDKRELIGVPSWSVEYEDNISSSEYKLCYIN